MTFQRNYHHALRGGFFILLILCMLPLDASATNCNCKEDWAIPPFLSESVNPNLLLLIDNSASMLDLAYVSDTSTCYDDTYTDGSSYAGYFDPKLWYAYDFTTEKFVAITEEISACGGTQYSSDYLCMSLTETYKFYASGNFLNWASASKLDIQKEILTGGKYDDKSQSLKKESRGCGNRRFIKKFQVDYNGSATFATLAIRPPAAQTYQSWRYETTYFKGDVVSNSKGDLYSAKKDVSGGSGPPGNDWEEYWQTRWKDGVTYPAGALVTDPKKANTLDRGTVYITHEGGTASGTGVDDDQGVDDWEPYNLTHIEVFEGSFDHIACQEAIDNLGSAKPNLGQLKSQIDNCMGTSNKNQKGGAGAGSVDANNAFNHSIQDCWGLIRHGEKWDPKNNRMKQDCGSIYEDDINPWDITPYDRAYVCYGEYTGDPDDLIGYVGRCYHPGYGQWQCKQPGNKWPEECPKLNQQTCVGDCSPPGWHPAGYTDADTCIDEALLDFCHSIAIPEAIDPSDQMGSAAGADDVWGLPGMLADTGVMAQLGEPIFVMKGFIDKTDAPEGLIQKNADDIRMGVMVFNYMGSAAECTQQDPFVLYDCSDGNQDGGKVILEIGQSDAHTVKLVNAINGIKAYTWTPLAEAFYNVIGYFKQDAALRLNADDFSIGPDPIEYWCQNNNVLIITEGASTADRHSDVATFLQTTDPNCGVLDGSTLLDDLTEFAKQTEGLFGQNAGINNQNINTHIVAVGTLRDEGAGSCNPKTLLELAAQKGGTSLYIAEDVKELEDHLLAAFAAIRAGAKGGSAASVISATRSGEGAVYQAIFWPSIDGPHGKDDEATWAGEVHALLVDAYGQIFEDTDGDMALTDADKRVIFFFDEHGSPAETKACYGTIEDGVCNGEVKSLHDVKYLWSAAEWLADISDVDILINRTGHISNEKRRYIFTWNDLNNNGIVDPGEILDFDTSTDWGELKVSSDRRDVPHDFGVEPTDEVDVDKIVSWVRGKDSEGLRSRQVVKPSNFNVTPSVGNTITWRLGDIIHSTPTVVGRPAESYHLLYQDSSYAAFAAKYKDRRQVVYFGGNDGKIHAVNGGFYNEDEKKYCLTPDCANSGSAPALGAELWAYVPYNLQPQLKCLLDPDYLHRYYVDQKPRIFDVQIFAADDDHYPGGWGTILVAGMRFGGNTVSAVLPDNRRFTSSYVIFDITNPEEAPKLLGELTYDPGTSVHMGYTTAVPTVVPMKSGSETKWYLVLGSGPIWLDESGDWESDKALEGRSNQPGKIAVFPLNALTQSLPDPFRILKDASNGTMHWVLKDEKNVAIPNSFISDLITVDFDLDKDYRGDAVYFGTVEGDWEEWTGKMYRFRTGADAGMTEPEKWKAPQLLFDPDRPITAAASIGWDGYNHWVYFGTGRFFDKKDKKDLSSNGPDYYFGIKEPKKCTNGIPSFEWEAVSDFNKLVRTDQIQVEVSSKASAALLSCSDESTSCLPTGVETLTDLIDYVAGKGCEDANPSGKPAGWYQQLPFGERNLGQATLLGGLLTYTTYQPFDDVCLPDGLSYLSAVYYQTGTAWHKPVFGSPYGLSSGEPSTVLSRFELGHGLATTPNLHVGRQEGGATAFIQTSTGAIVEIGQELPIKNVKSGRINWRSD
jgi:type IV pilus assembly protein PilY1